MGSSPDSFQSLYDKFPIAQKRDYVTGLMGLGSVFKILVKFKNGDERDKLIILVGSAEQKYAFVVINSEVNTNVSQNIQNAHLKLDYIKYPDFLRYDSFVACDFLYDIGKPVLHSLVLNNIRKHLGKVCEDDLNRIKCHLIRSGIIRKYTLDHWGIFCNSK